VNYYRRFPGDYARDTKHLTMIEHGAYNLLLDTLYSTEKVLPKSLASLFRICSASTKREKKAVVKVLNEFFIKKPTGFSHKRFEEEVSNTESRRKASQDNGKHGGRPPKSETQQVSSRLEIETQKKATPDSRLQTPDLNSNTERAELPIEWLPLMPWRQYQEMRVKLKRPLSAGGIEILIEKLRGLRDQGEDLTEVLEQATSGGWFDLRPVRKEKASGGNHESFDEKRRRKSKEAISDVRGNLDRLVPQVERGLPESRNYEIADRRVCRSLGGPLAQPVAVGMPRSDQDIGKLSKASTYPGSS
jgi:uncharacterized protein YdaU (DUF1376 family)